MGKSWQVGIFWGIPVKVHWSFGLIILFITYTLMTSDLELWQSIAYAFTVLAVFLCVILHEYGHALTGKKLGIKTQDIIISPIGGVARMERMPTKPFDEFVITIAGPLVNLVLGLGIGLGFYIFTGQFSMNLDTYDLNQPIEYLRLLVPINLTLFLFNLIPAFPMDGGRILRSILAARIGRLKATKIASYVGRFLAICFVAYGVFNQALILSLIGLFIFMMAGQEYNHTKLMDVINNVTVGDIMRTSFTQLHLSDNYHTIIDKYHRNGEHNFLVFDSMGNLSGTIPELFIKDILKSKQLDTTAQQLMSTQKGTAYPHEKIKTIINDMRQEGLSIVAVVKDDQIIGVLDRNGIEDYLRLSTN